MAARLSEKNPGWLVWSSGRLSRTLGFWLLQAAGWAAFALMMLGYALVSERPQQAIFYVLLLVLTGFGLTTLYRCFYRPRKCRSAH